MGDRDVVIPREVRTVFRPKKTVPGMDACASLSYTLTVDPLNRKRACLRRGYGTSVQGVGSGAGAASPVQNKVSSMHTRYA